MSNLVLRPTARTARRTRPVFDQFPGLGSLLNDIWNEELPTELRSNFNDGMTLPKVNVKETPDSFQVQMAAPGFKKDHFDISVENEELLISAEIEKGEEDTDEEFTRREFGYASFQRTFLLPETIEGDKIKAKYEDGILSVTLPKKEEAKPKPVKRIKVS
jgi:HSP20 family protein